jgi:hypothetical protein
MAVVPLLAPHSDVLTYDCRGNGQSAREDDYKILELVAHVHNG